MTDRSMNRFCEALAESIKESADVPPGVIVTLVHAEITGDSKYAKGTLSVLPEDRTDEVLDVLASEEKYIKESLNKKLRLRRVPDLQWTVDRTEKKAAEVEGLLKDLRDRGEL